MVFKRSIFISLVSHAALFSLFSLTFGNKILPVDYTYISFLGQILPHFQDNPAPFVMKHNFNMDKNNIKTIFVKNPDMLTLKTVTQNPLYNRIYHLKPPSNLIFNNEKELFIAKTVTLPPVLPKREQMIILHPLLPYSFGLYFKNRQVAHVELMFQIVPAGMSNSILVKRKISSGNLEVDLLSMRYIGHYLFIQQNSFAPNSWQSVKIDLSEKE